MEYDTLVSSHWLETDQFWNEITDIGLLEYYTFNCKHSTVAILPNPLRVLELQIGSAYLWLSWQRVSEVLQPR